MLWCCWRLLVQRLITHIAVSDINTPSWPGPGPAFGLSAASAQESCRVSVGDRWPHPLRLQLGTVDCTRLQKLAEMDSHLQQLLPSMTRARSHLLHARYTLFERSLLPLSVSLRPIALSTLRVAVSLLPLPGPAAPPTDRL